MSKETVTTFCPSYVGTPILQRNPENLKRNANKLKKLVNDDVGANLSHQMALDAVSSILGWESWNGFYTAVLAGGNNPEYRWWHNLRSFEKVSVIRAGKVRFERIMQSVTNVTCSTLKEMKQLDAWFDAVTPVVKDAVLTQPDTVFNKVTSLLRRNTEKPSPLVTYANYSEMRKQEGTLIQTEKGPAGRSGLSAYLSQHVLPALEQRGILAVVEGKDATNIVSALHQQGYKVSLLSPSGRATQDAERCRDAPSEQWVPIETMDYSLFELFGLGDPDNETNSANAIASVMRGGGIGTWAAPTYLSIRFFVAMMAYRTEHNDPLLRERSLFVYDDLLFYYASPEIGRLHELAKELIEKCDYQGRLQPWVAEHGFPACFKERLNMPVGRPKSDDEKEDTLLSYVYTQMVEQWCYTVMGYSDLLQNIRENMFYTDTVLLDEALSINDGEARVVVFEQSDRGSMSQAFALKQRFLSRRAQCPYNTLMPAVILSSVTLDDVRSGSVLSELIRQGIVVPYENGELVQFDVAGFIPHKRAKVWPVFYTDASGRLRGSLDASYFATRINLASSEKTVTVLDGLTLACEQAAGRSSEAARNTA